VVDDTATGQIVASTGLFANTATYEDIPFTLGRAAIVATEVAYRNRGLQRAIFDLIHARSAARGHRIQGITGIHYYYRQFGYEYAVDLEAARHVYVAALPSLRAGEAAPYMLRPALEDDFPLLMELSARERACWQLATVRDERAWRWTVCEANPAAGNPGVPYLITTAEGTIILNEIGNREPPG
jgi:hypothetical protein